MAMCSDRFPGITRILKIVTTFIDVRTQSGEQDGQAVCAGSGDDRADSAHHLGQSVLRSEWILDRPDLQGQFRGVPGDQIDPIEPVPGDETPAVEKDDTGDTACADERSHGRRSVDRELCGIQTEPCAHLLGIGAACT